MAACKLGASLYRGGGGGGQGECLSYWGGLLGRYLGAGRGGFRGEGSEGGREGEREEVG